MFEIKIGPIINRVENYNFENGMTMFPTPHYKMHLRASINYIDKQGGGSRSNVNNILHKLGNKGGGGQKSSKFCQRSL